MNTEARVGPKDEAEGKSTDMLCPDPSAHKTKDTALQEHASAAALYSTQHMHGEANTRNPLGTDGKLSSASAATSLKHANAHDLPSFPVVGIDTRTSAGTAANLASSHAKSPEWWKPSHSSAAGRAAFLAKDYKMQPLWQPEASAAGSKAALLAHQDGGKLNLWTHQPSAAGNSAANIAMGRKGAAPAGGHADQHTGALLAATGAVSSSGRRRAQSNPAPPPLYPDAGNSARNALSAATIAHSPSMRAPKTGTVPPSTFGSPAMQAARVQHSKVPREMYTEHPPVAIEVEEKKHQDALRASAISMAKKMYNVQQQHIDQASGRASQAQTGATAAHQHMPDAGEDDIKAQAMRYIGIQEAAQKLAAERLAKIGVDENALYRSYYGYDKPGRSKLSIRRGRPRAASNPEPVDSDDDEFQSRRIRSQMSQFNKTLAEVDKKKQEQDRRHLLAAAERKVHAQMLGMDKKIFDETGKMSPAMLDEWDAKARAKAAANSEARMEHHGRVHIGQGKYMDQADIDAVAQAKVQPTLDEITEKTEKRRAEEEEQRLEAEERKRQAQTQKERAAEIKAEEKRGKEEDKKALKSKNAEEKAAARQEKEAEKEKRAEEKRLAKEEKRKSGKVAAPPVDTTTSPTHVVLRTDDEDDPTTPTTPTTPTSPSKGIKSLLSKLKRRSKPPPPNPDAASSADKGDKAGFIGGIALRNTESRTSAPASPSVEDPQPSGRRFSDVSSLSSSTYSNDGGDGDEPERIPTRVSAASAVSPNSEYEEARDGFDEDLAPPPSFTASADGSAAAAGRRGSPNRGSKFIEVL